MKTPRNILLERHAPAAPKLDELRKAVVSTIRTESASASWTARFPGFLHACWSELIRPYRPVWTGLAGIWLALIAFNLCHNRPAQVGFETTSPPPAEVRFAFQEQQRLLAELIGQGPPVLPAEPPPRPDTRPRSERRKPFLFT